MGTFITTPFTIREWKYFGYLYLLCTLSYYCATWKAYGGFAGGHPPFLDLEEFVAAAGMKFTVFLVLSLLLFRVLPPLDRLSSGTRFILLQLLGLVAFVYVADELQTFLLARFEWAHFFGGRLYVFNHLIAGGFYLLQLCFVAALNSRGRETQVQGNPLSDPAREAPTTTEWLLARRGKHEVPLQITQVTHLLANGNYCRATTADGQYLLAFGIGAAEARFPAPNFLRIHRSYLVNLTSVARLSRNGRKHQVELTDGTVLPIGEKYLGRLRELRD